MSASDSKGFAAVTRMDFKTTPTIFTYATFKSKGNKMLLIFFHQSEGDFSLHFIWICSHNNSPYHANKPRADDQLQIEMVKIKTDLLAKGEVELWPGGWGEQGDSQEEEGGVEPG